MQKNTHKFVRTFQRRFTYETYFISRAVLLHKGNIIGDITTLELEEKNIDLMDYLKQSYSYKANRVMETLMKNEKGVD